jgi:DNA-binding transcriptional ArsR family regulator
VLVAALSVFGVIFASRLANRQPRVQAEGAMPARDVTTLLVAIRVRLECGGAFDTQANTCIIAPRTTDLMNIEKVFKALGDPTRVKVLDLLYERNGQTLGELCEHLAMSRQSATQHIGVLEAANLVTAVWRGREKLHFINPMPLHEVYERWVRKFERQRLSLLHDLKQELEGE